MKYYLRALLVVSAITSNKSLSMDDKLNTIYPCIIDNKAQTTPPPSPEKTQEKKCPGAPCKKKFNREQPQKNYPTTLGKRKLSVATKFKSQRKLIFN